MQQNCNVACELLGFGSGGVRVFVWGMVLHHCMTGA